MTEREALKLALEAFEYIENNYMSLPAPATKTITAIKEALAQPEQELLAWKNAALRVGEDLSSIGPNGYYNMTAQQWLDWAMAQQPRGNNSLAQPEQEPVACASLCVECTKRGDWVCAKAIPPQRTWVGLTDEDKKEYVSRDFGGNRLDAMDWAEKRLKEKNT